MYIFTTLELPTYNFDFHHTALSAGCASCMQRLLGPLPGLNKEIHARKMAQKKILGLCFTENNFASNVNENKHAKNSKYSANRNK